MLLTSAVALCLAPTAPVQAAKSEEWPFCHRLVPLFDDGIQIADEAAQDDNASPTEITADYSEGLNNRLYTVRGNVFIRRGSQTLQSDHAEYDDDTGLVDAVGSVRFRQRGFLVEGGLARFNLSTATGDVKATRYQYLDHHAYGEAETLVRESADVTQLYRASYTTCDPDKIDWELRARHVTLHQDEAVGVARGVTIRFKDVPLLYLPYMTFPLNDERKSGLLPPTIGYDDRNGLDIGIPYYWNIAPDRDATITPRILQNRGLLTRAEFRYLNPSNRGQVEAEYLPNDAIFGKDRGALSAQHQHRLAQRWYADSNFNYVSDAQYFANLGGNLSTTSITHLDRRLDLNYAGDYNQFLARVQDYQTIDPTLPPAARPYRRLPQLLFVSEAPSHPLNADYGVRAEYVRFERRDSVTGTRINLQPSVAWSLETLGYFVVPKLGVHYTGYELDNVPPGAANSPQHSVPVYSVDSGLYLERDIALGDLALTQTLEPRLYYLRIPYRNQDDFPVFDTTLFDFSFSQLFRENRFTNPDRIGDANQISAGLTSRLLERDSGREWLRASIGQIYYFESPRVTLPGIAVPERGESDLIAELTTRLTTRWTATANLQWNPEAEQIQKSGVQFHYERDHRHLFNAGYRFRRGELAQSDFSVFWPLGPQWQFVGRWNYSYRDNRVLETLAGLQYDSCCWAFRATSRRYVSSFLGDSSQALYFELEMKGLGSIGQSIEDVLERGILGYRPR